MPASTPCPSSSPAGFSFDLSPLRRPDGGYYNISTPDYDYHINVCGPLATARCPANAGSCQVDKRSVHTQGAPAIGL